MARKAANGIDEKSLSKGQLRKLIALRKSLGEEIANRAFVEWLANSDGASSTVSDRNAEIISDTVMALVRDQNLQFPRGGYIVRRGRGRVIVERNSGTEE
jgi:hypothetical protein